MATWRWLSKQQKQERYEHIIKLKEQGLTNKQIGARLGITGDRVGQIIKEANEEMAKR